MHGEEKKTNMKLENNNIKTKMEKDLECNNKNQDTPRNKKAEKKQCKYKKRYLKYSYSRVQLF